MKARNRALGWMLLCYPATPPAFVAGVEGCMGHREYLAGVALFYTLLLFALWRCTRACGKAGWAFGLALVATLVHLYAAGRVVFDMRSSTEEAMVIMTMFGVAVLVGVGGAQIAFQEGRRLMALLFLGSCAGLGWALTGYRSPLDDPRLFLASFFLQAALLFFLRWGVSESDEGTGFIQSQK